MEEISLLHVLALLGLGAVLHFWAQADRERTNRQRVEEELVAVKRENSELREQLRGLRARLGPWPWPDSEDQTRLR